MALKISAEQNWLARHQAWLSAFGTKDGIPLCDGGIPSFLPTCFWVLACETAGVGIPKERLGPVRSCILDGWDARYGCFVPGDLRREDMGGHSAEYLRMQASYFAIHALHALGDSLGTRLGYVKDFRSKEYLRGWLDGGPWSNPWLHSNNIMFALAFLQADYFWFDCDESIAAFDFILDYLDKRQDPTSGLWQPDSGVDNRNAVYAAYHFFPYYFWRGRCPLYVEQIIDTTLSIQDGQRLFGGGACEDLDAIHTLVMMSLVSSHRDSDIRRALLASAQGLLELQNPDGGFPNYPDRIQPLSWKRRLAIRLGVNQYLPVQYRSSNTGRKRWRYSSWRQLECPYGQSDVWGGWFRPLALNLIQERYSLCQSSGVDRCYRALPGLGWHDVEKIRAAASS